MTEEQLREQLRAGDFVPAGEKWASAADALATLEAIGHCGWVFLVKVDGLRTANRFTVLLSRSTPGSEPFRRDGAELAPLLRSAIEFFLAA